MSSGIIDLGDVAALALLGFTMAGSAIGVVRSYTKLGDKIEAIEENKDPTSVKNNHNG